MRYKSSRVKAARRILLLAAILLGGCHTAKDVAVTSFRVLDAPANYVRQKIDTPTQTTTTTTTTTAASDVNTPGRTVAVTANNREKSRRQVTTQTQSQPSPTATPHVSRTATVEKSKPSPTPGPRTVTSQAPQYPTAKPVPGKPGYVFSPFDPSGGYVDVNGYTSGSKVKDPYSGKIFLVP
jgi:hypothetical protein